MTKSRVQHGKAVPMTHSTSLASPAPESDELPLTSDQILKGRALVKELHARYAYLGFVFETDLARRDSWQAICTLHRRLDRIMGEQI
jgi:hypothetical protein